MSWKYQQTIREVRFSTRNSKVTESSTLLGLQSRVKSTVDLESSLVSPRRDRNLSIMSAATPNRSGVISKKVVKSEVMKRNYLTRVLMCRMLNVRYALKQMQLIPQSTFRPGPSFEMAKKIVMKGRINLESSVLRTLLFAFDRSGNKKILGNMKVERMDNLFVLPQGKDQLVEERNAILKLIGIIGQYKRLTVRQFQKNGRIGQALQRYWSRFYENVAGSCQQAFFRLKMLPDRKKPESLVDGGMLLSKKMGVLVGLSDKYTMLQREAIKCIYTNYVVIKCEERHIAKTVLTYAKLRKEQAFQLWRNSQPVVLKKQKVQIIVVEAKKLEALTRLVQHRYFRLFFKISRKLQLIKRVAVRLACNTQINEQKAFWRMLANAQGGFM